MVNSKERLKGRILYYIKEINLEHVVFKWKYRLDEIPETKGCDTVNVHCECIQ